MVILPPGRPPGSKARLGGEAVWQQMSTLPEGMPCAMQSLLAGAEWLSLQGNGSCGFSPTSGRSPAPTSQPCALPAGLTHAHRLPKVGVCLPLKEETSSWGVRGTETWATQRGATAKREDGEWGPWSAMPSSASCTFWDL